MKEIVVIYIQTYQIPILSYPVNDQTPCLGKEAFKN